MDKSHSEPVYCTIWTASKTGMEIMTTSEAVFGLNFSLILAFKVLVMISVGS